MITLLAINLHIYIAIIFSKFGGLGTFEQLKQGHKIEKLHVMAGSKLLKKCFHGYRYSDSLFLILVGWSV